MGSLGVRVLPSGVCQLYHTRKGGLSTFCSGAQTAYINGGEIHVQLKNGKVHIYRINNSETGVLGPVRTF